jgi:hypothetical protein
LSNVVSGVPGPAVAERLIAETKREAMAAKRGRRDAQWALRWHVQHARHLIYVETMLLSATAETTEAYGWNFVETLRQRLFDAPNLRVIVSMPREIPFGAGYEGWAKHFYDARREAVDRLKAQAPDRVVAFHPIGFPGKPEVQRGNVVIVDDVWGMLGTSTLSRRGLTFDGGIDVSLLDRELRDGVSLQIRDLRRLLMARTLGRQRPSGTDTPDPGWTRLAQTSAAFELVAEMLEHGGEGVIEDVWDGPSDVLAQSAAIANPEGRDFDTEVLASAAMGAALATLGGARI